jgi:hypothetical protein
MDVPNGYDHKATSEGFNGADKVSVYYHRVFNDYLVYVHSNQEEEGKTLYVSRAQLALIVHAGKDVLDDERV